MKDKLAARKNKKIYIFIAVMMTAILILSFLEHNLVKAAYTTESNAGTSSFPENDKYTYIEVKGPSGTSTLKLQVQQGGSDAGKIYKDYSFDKESRELFIKKVSTSDTDPYKIKLSTSSINTIKASTTNGQYSWMNIKIKYTVPAHQRYKSVTYDSPSSKSHVLTNTPEHKTTDQQDYETTIGLSVYDTGVAPYRNPNDQKYYRYYNCKVTIDLQKDQYKVTYKGNGGTIDSSAESKSFNCGDILTFPEAVRDGYKNTGWKDTADASGNSYDTSSVICGSDLTLYAQWKQGEYKVSLLPNGAPDNEKMVALKNGEKATLPKNTFERSGYVFAGWNKDKDSLKAEFQDMQEVKNLAEDGENIKLYAIWKKKDGSFNTTNIIHDQDMFTGDIEIEGGNQTEYDSTHTDSEYARIDKEGKPGYFTDQEEYYETALD